MQFSWEAWGATLYRWDPTGLGSLLVRTWAEVSSPVLSTNGRYALAADHSVTGLTDKGLMQDSVDTPALDYLSQVQRYFSRSRLIITKALL